MARPKRRAPKEVEAPTNIKVKNEEPPIYKSVCKAFGKKDIHAFFTYGDTMYNPSELEVPSDVLVHEAVHMEQQKHSEEEAELWWGKYLRDPQFRLDQEARAYGKQFKALCGVRKDRNHQARLLIILARSLSGPLYNNIVSHSEAMKLIKQHSGVR